MSITPKEHECNPGTIKGNNYSVAADKRKELPNPHIKEDIGLCNFRMADFQKDMSTLTTSQALLKPIVKADIDSWIKGFTTTQQPELKGSQREIQDLLNNAKKDNIPITDLDGRLGNVFCRSIAKSYGNICTKAK